jgi:hypothetical protein
MDVNDEIITLFKDEFKVRAIPNVQSSESEVDNNGGTDNNNNNAVNSNNSNNEQQRQQPIYQNDKVYYALYHHKQTRYMKIDTEKYSYYDFIERIEFSKQKSGAYINSLNLNENKIILVQNTNGVYSSRIKHRSGTIRADNKNLLPRRGSISSAVLANQALHLKQLSDKVTGGIASVNQLNIFQQPSNNMNTRSNNIKKPSIRSKKRFPTIVQSKKMNMNLKRKENLISSNNIISNYVYPINDFFTNEVHGLC